MGMTSSSDSAGLSSLDHWRLCEELSIVQAALLVVGQDPSTELENVERWEVTERPHGYEATRTALVSAVRQGEILATIVYLTVDPTLYPDRQPETIDPRRTLLKVSAMREWLSARGVTSTFFGAARSSVPDYLDPQHPRYAPKLAAAVSAWTAVGDPPPGKTPKHALEKWLRENAPAFGLSDRDGKLNEQGIRECAKVANWQPNGGAPKTPGG